MKKSVFLRGASFAAIVTAFLVSGAILSTMARRAVAAPPIPPTTMDFRNTDTGEPLDLSNAQEEGRDTPAVKKFFQTGVNPYLEDKSCLKTGESLFLTSCSGCHGEIGEGKIGPGLNDDYWTYPKNMADQGLFETIFGGARAQMGPHYLDLTLDDMLQVMAWVRHLYKDDVKNAPWLNEAQKKAYAPYKIGETFAADAPGMCAVKKNAQDQKADNAEPNHTTNGPKEKMP